MSKRYDVDVGGTTLSISSPDKVYWKDLDIKKRDLISYYLEVMDGALLGARDRPVVLKRFVKGVFATPFFQKRAPKSPPPFVETATFHYRSGRSATEVVITSPAVLIWSMGLGCLELNPHPVRKNDLEHPDELRIDLDPNPGVAWPEIEEVALVCKDVLDELGLASFPKTSGSRGLHILCRIEPKWTFPEVRAAAQGIAREVASRAPHIATSRWWKEERSGVFIDFNQNAKDRTVCSAYSVRPTEDARVSAPLDWSELPGTDPSAFTLKTMPVRFTDVGDLHRDLDARAYSLEAALALAKVHEERADKDKERPGDPIPVVEVARAKEEEVARLGLARWHKKHPEVGAHLRPDDVLIDRMRGRYSTWTRIRVRLSAVPEDIRPTQGELECDYDVREEWR